MLGMVGVIIQNETIVNTTTILQEVKPGEKYLVRFLNPPQFNRVCNVEEIQQWLLFQNQEEGNAWIKANSQQPQMPPGAPPPPPGDSSAPHGDDDDQTDDS